MGDIIKFKGLENPTYRLLTETNPHLGIIQQVLFARKALNKDEKERLAVSFKRKEGVDVVRVELFTRTYTIVDDFNIRDPEELDHSYRLFLYRCLETLIFSTFDEFRRKEN